MKPAGRVLDWVTRPFGLAEYPLNPGPFKAEIHCRLTRPRNRRAPGF